MLLDKVNGIIQSCCTMFESTMLILCYGVMLIWNVWFFIFFLLTFFLTLCISPIWISCVSVNTTCDAFWNLSKEHFLTSFLNQTVHTKHYFMERDDRYFTQTHLNGLKCPRNHFIGSGIRNTIIRAILEQKWRWWLYTHHPDKS